MFSGKSVSGANMLGQVTGLPGAPWNPPTKASHEWESGAKKEEKKTGVEKI